MGACRVTRVTLNTTLVAHHTRPDQLMQVLAHGAKPILSALFIVDYGVQCQDHFQMLGRLNLSLVVDVACILLTPLLNRFSRLLSRITMLAILFILI